MCSKSSSIVVASLNTGTITVSRGLSAGAPPADGNRESSAHTRDAHCDVLILHLPSRPRFQVPPVQGVNGLVVLVNVGVPEQTHVVAIFRQFPVRGSRQLVHTQTFIP